MPLTTSTTSRSRVHGVISEPEHRAGQPKDDGVPQWWDQIRLGVFLVLVLVFFRYGVDLRLIYHGGGELPIFPVFYWGQRFLGEAMRRPGGGLEYLSALEMQALYSFWLGPLVLTLHVWLTLILFKALAAALGLVRSSIAGYLGALAHVGLYCRYAHFAAPVANLDLMLLLLLILARSKGMSLGVRFSILTLCTAIVYVTAAGAMAVFILSLMLFALHKREWRLAVAGLPSGVAASRGLGHYWYGLGADEVWWSILPIPLEHNFSIQPGFWILGALFFLPLGIVAYALCESWSHRMFKRSESTQVTPSKGRKIERSAKSARKTRCDLMGPWAKWSLQTTSLCAALVAVFFFSHDRRMKSALEVDFYATREMWPEALRAAQGHLNDPFVGCTATQAGFHTGQLTRELPHLEKSRDLLLLTGGAFAHWKQSGLYLDLGYVNLALHHLTEAVEFWGERPLLLRRLATANLALGNTNTAKIYLRALSRVAFHGGWAREYLECLEKDPSLQWDAEVVRLRSLMVKEDVTGHLSAETQLLLLLQANPKNRMAYQYLMTYYLLEKNLAQFAANLPRMQDFSGFELPPLWDEALVLFNASKGRSLAGETRAPSSAAEQRFAKVVQVLRASGDNREAARRELESAYGKTYFYYHLFHP